MRALLLLPVLFAVGCVYTVQPTPQPYTQASAPPAAQSPAATGGEVLLAGGDGTEVMVEGAAANDGDLGIARDRAIRDALRKAVEQGVGTYLNSDTRVENFQLLSDRIYTQASGYVSSYRVVGEWQEGGLYRVAVRARVKMERLQDDLGAIGLLIDEQGRPRVMVLLKELDNPDDFLVDDKLMSQQLLETMILDAFQSRGFPVVDAATVEQNLRRDQLKAILAGDDAAARALGERTGAEVVVAGTAQRSTRTATVPYSGTTTEMFKVRVSARVVNVATGAVLGAAALWREVPFSEDEARRAAAETTSAKLISDIVNGWKRRRAALEIHCDNADFTRVQKLRSELLAKVRGVRVVVMRDLIGSQALLEVTAETSPQEIMDDLTAKKLAVGFDVLGLVNNRINIRFTGDAPLGGGGK
jgi:TolB-like protein